MSLKAFHIVFIVASILLAFGFAAWAFVNSGEEGGTSLKFYGFGSAAVSANSLPAVRTSPMATSTFSP